MLDVLTGPEVSFGLFYLIPIALVVWFAGRTLGLAMSIASAVAWILADTWGGQSYSLPAIRYWNGFVRLGFFIVVTWLMPALKALEREKELARIDEATGAANRRAFLELLQRELDRARRYKRALTLVYMDIDNFKAVNDKLGHTIGDRVLGSVVSVAGQHLRKSDVVARLGGDEFAFLLPETNREGAERMVPTLRLALLQGMGKHGWSVTFSFGVLTCLEMPKTLDDLIRRADDLMYAAKRLGKNTVSYGTYGGFSKPSSHPTEAHPPNE